MSETPRFKLNDRQKLAAAIDRLIESGKDEINVRELAKDLNMTIAQVGMLLREVQSEEFELKKEPRLERYRSVPYWKIHKRSRL